VLGIGGNSGVVIPSDRKANSKAVLTYFLVPRLLGFDQCIKNTFRRVTVPQFLNANCRRKGQDTTELLPSSPLG